MVRLGRGVADNGLFSSTTEALPLSHHVLGDLSCMCLWFLQMEVWSSSHKIHPADSGPPTPAVLSVLGTQRWHSVALLPNFTTRNLAVIIQVVYYY